MPPPPPPAKDAVPAPGPTPPSSTSIIPPLCFPSPTSVAHVVNQPPSKAAGSAPPSSAPSQTAVDTPTPDTASHAASLPPRPPPTSPSLPFYYHRPELENPAPTAALSPVTKAAFVAALDDFIAHAPPNRHEPPTVLINRIRLLLDHLDALTEQLTLKVTTSLFDVLAQQECLSLLLFLLADISARSSPVMTDVRKSFRYPYLVANILANGSAAIRDAFVGSVALVTHILSFLDGHVVLTTAARKAPSEGADASEKTESEKKVVFARDNPIIVGNVVQILVSYLETSPEALLQAFQARPSLIPSLVNLLHIGSVPKLLNSIIPDRCVDDICAMDLGNVSFDRPMRHALTLLSSANIFHLLAESFEEATQTIFSLVERGGNAPENPQKFAKAEELSFNILQVYATLVNKTVRAVRLQPSTDICNYLHVYANPKTASTLSHILKAGTELFRGTDGKQVSTLNLALGLAIDMLKYVDQDRVRRVASVTGQPPDLQTNALEEELSPMLRKLMDLLIDIVCTGHMHGQTRLRIMELFVECQRICSVNMVTTLDSIRFGEVAMKMMMMNPRNSLMQHVIIRAVESALVFNQSDEFARHWLVKSKLPQKIMRTWQNERGSERWDAPARAQEAPFLSALVHMACCVEHWMAMKREPPYNGGQVLETDAVREVLSDEVICDFESFCASSLHSILEAEQIVLGGPRPRRRPTMSPGNTLGRSFGSFGTTSGAMLRRTSSLGNGSLQKRAHLVRSPSAHRFGYVSATTTTARSRLDDMFIEHDLDAGDGGGGFGMRLGSTASSATGSAASFASIFDTMGD